MSRNAHIVRPLVGVIRQANASLRQAIAVLAESPSKDALTRLSEEANSLSMAVSALAKVVPLDQLDPPKTTAPERATGELLDVSDRLLAALDNGLCEACGGARRQPLTEEQDD